MTCCSAVRPRLAAAVLGLLVLSWALPATAASPRRLLGEDFTAELTRLAEEGSSQRFRVLVRCEAAASDEDAPAALRSEADLAADDLLSYVAAREPASSEGSDPTSPRRLWMVNAVALSLRAPTLLDVARRRGVAAIARVTAFPARPRPPAQPAPLDRLLPLGVMSPPTMLGADLVRLRHGIDGTGVVLGHIDTGVDASHPALAGAVAGWRDFIDGSSEPRDGDGHGTHTAGILAGRAVGLGVAPGARLLVARALDDTGNGTLESLLAAMQWMLDPDGDPTTDDQPVAVCNSWGIERVVLQSAGIDESYFLDAVQAWRRAGIVPVFSIGNGGVGNQSVPGAYPMVLSVGAVDQELHVAPFSASGIAPWGARRYLRPDLVTPGVDVLSALPNGMMGRMSGTSQAAPQVAGLCALVKQANPSLGRADIERLILESCRDLGETGRDMYYGEGLPNALTAVAAALGPVR